MISKVETSEWDCVDLQMLNPCINSQRFYWFFKVSKKIKEVLQILKFLIPNFELERKYMPCNKTNQKLIFWLVIHFFLKLLKSILKATHLPTLYTQQFVFNLCDRNNRKEK